MTMLTPASHQQSLDRKSLRDQLVDEICQLIATRQLVPGQRLPTEKQLQARYGVSHTVVREALTVLESRGLVDVRHGTGTFLNPPEAWDIAGPIGFLVRSDRVTLLNWLEVRTALEVEAAALAARRATDQDVALLREAARKMEEACASGQSTIAAEIGFHVQIAQATGNPSMPKVIRPVLEPLTHVLAQSAQPDNLEKAIAEHREICRFIALHDPDAARRAMRQHMARVAEEIEQLSLL